MTTTEEENFPRGGAVSVDKPRKRKAKAEKDLFSTRQDDQAPKAKKRKDRHMTLEKRVALKKKKDKKTDQVLKSNLNQVTQLNYGVCPVGMLLLGCVKEVHDYHLDVSLPNGMIGKLPITAISDSYTKLLQALAAGDYEGAEDVHGLNEIFRPGMVLQCKITEVVKSAKNNKISLTLTINPRELNSNFTSATLKNGLVMSGCVSSCEDHGYLVDIGVKTVCAFLPKDDAEQYVQDHNGGEPLHLGSYLHCMLNMDMSMDRAVGESRTVHVTVNPQQVFKAVMTKGQGITMNTILPGMRVTTKVFKVSDEGITVDFLRYTGTIHKSHLTQEPKQFTHHQEVTAAVLFVHPVSKVVGLTSLPHLVTPHLAPRRLFGKLSIGQILEDTKVHRLEAKRGVYLRLPGKILGFAGLGSLSDSEVKDVNHEFPKASLVRCRIMSFDYCDKLVYVTLKKSILSQRYMSYADISPTDDIEVEVLKVTRGGVTVKVSGHIQGFIPNSHMADVPLKHPEKRFIPGTKVSARVLSVEIEKKNVILTTKKTILKSSYPQVTEYDQVEEKMALEGVVTNVGEKGLRVLFYNSVKGFVPKKQCGTEFESDLSKAFYVGQVVRVRVLKCVPEEKNLILTMKTADPKRETPVLPTPVELTVGEVVTAVVNGKSHNGLFVTVSSGETNNKVKAFIPKAHLSDHAVNADLWWEVHEQGDTIKDCVVFSIGKQVFTSSNEDRSLPPNIGSRSTLAALAEETPLSAANANIGQILSRKQCIVASAKDGTFVKNFEDIKIGMLLPGVVRNHQDYGIFVQLASSLIGLVPNKYVCDEKLPNPSALYPPGQSLVVKVTEVDESKKRVLLSMRLKDCCHASSNKGVDLLQGYLKEAAEITGAYTSKGSESQKALVSHRVGEVVNVTVTKVTDQGALCVLEDGTKGVATEDHIREVKCEVTTKLPAVVLHVDLAAGCVELSLNTSLIQKIRTYSESKFSRPRSGQVVKSEVLLIKDGCVLIALKGHTLGLLAYLPARLHLNDALEKRQYQVTQQNAVVIKRTSDLGIIACLQLHEPKDQDKEKGLTHNLLPGVIVKAKVSEVLDFQMNVRIGRVRGRVHITEVTDKAKKGQNPLKKYKPNQELKVKVVGYRDLHTGQHLPPSDTNLHKALPECSVRPSVLNVTGLSSSEDVYTGSRFQVGEHVTFYVQNLNKGILWGCVSPKYRGRVHRLNISRDAAVQKAPLEHFKAGCGYRATITKVCETNSVLDLSFIGLETTIEAGQNVSGSVKSAGPGGLQVSLQQGYVGRVALTHMGDTYQDQPWTSYSPGQSVTVHVINCDSPKKCVLSLRQSRLNPDSDTELPDPEVTGETVKKGDYLRGYITRITNDKVFVSVSPELGGTFVNKDAASTLSVGNVVKVRARAEPEKNNFVRLMYIKQSSGRTAETTVGEHEEEPVPRMNGMDRSRKRESSQSEDGESAAKRTKTETNKKKDKGSKKNTDENESNNRTTVTSGSERKPASLPLAGGFSWDGDFKLPPPTDVVVSDTDSDDDEEDGEKKSNSRQSRRERLEAQRAAERRLVEQERRLAGEGTEGLAGPETADELDRLVIQSPNSSMIWLRYMAFHLESSEVDKARSVAERALKTISFREEQEKWNVWVAYLNLETMYGTPETVQAVFDRALKAAEPLKLYTQLVQIYTKANKVEAAEKLYSIMIRRFSAHKDVWTGYGLFCFQHEKADTARQIMHRSLKSLQSKEHVEVLSKFAQLEFKYGEAERGKTMFENLLNTYPRRTDLWSVYIDMITKHADHHQVRNLFERVLALNMPAKKMKFFFKKQLDFEEKHGSAETVAAVKQKALEYVETRSDLT